MPLRSAKATGDSIFPLQYKGSKIDFYRFASRYRMAARFRAIDLDDFTEGTTAEYSALTRVFLAWSVFERYADLADDPLPFPTGDHDRIRPFAACPARFHARRPWSPALRDLS